MAAAKIDLKARLGRKSDSPAGAPAPGASVPPGYGQPGLGAPQAAPVPSPSAMPPAGSLSRPAPAMGGAAVGGAPHGGAPGMGAAGVGAPGVGGAARPAAAPAGARPVGPQGILGPSIPPPPGFGPKPQQVAAAAQPVAAASVAPAAAKPARPQAIKLEMGEEVIQAQKANRSKTMILAAATALVGLGIGYGIGGLVKGNEGAQAAVVGAEQLVKEIDEANLKIGELNDILKAAAGKVRENQFPSAEIEKLGGLEIPFDGTNLTNKGIGRYNAAAVTMLLNYSNSVAAVKDQRDKLRRLFGAVKEPFENSVKEQQNPVVHWSVVISDGPGGKWAKMTPLGDKAFAVADKSKPGYKWPTQLDVNSSKLELYGGKGEPGTTHFFPVDPNTERAVCPENLQFRLMAALVDLGNTIQGDQTPGHEVDGVIAQGEKLMDQLRKIGGSGA